MALAVHALSPHLTLPLTNARSCTQANKWVKNMEGKSGLKVLNLQMSDMARQIENAIQFGNPVLLQVCAYMRRGMACVCGDASVSWELLQV